MEFTAGCRKVLIANQNGFSLLEVLVALGVSLVVVGAIASFQSFQLTTLGAQAKQVDLQGTVRSVVDLVAREVRKTGRNPQCQAAVGGLVTATRSALRIQTDLSVPADGQVSSDNEDVTYQLDEASKSVVRIDNGKSRTDTLIENVDITGSGFHYFDSAGNELGASGAGSLDSTQCANVRRIRFDLMMVGTGPHKSSVAPRARASTNIDLRNRFFVAQNSACTPTVAQPTLPPSPTVGPTRTCAPSGNVCVDDLQCCKKQCKRDTNVADPNFFCL
jgi:prepilin-type N-terminal cleavage/methylation domain-containing protein